MHDVEGPAGLDKCSQVLKLERSLGFASSFNFIPEGDYRVSPELRREIVESGCEVGVHDLYHDGKLYRSREGFTKRAVEINKYLREWGAVGFRSAFMLNKLDWLHELNISYDASTFDTDPFEPQPQGQNTIFPFWVPRPGSLNNGQPRPSSDSNPQRHKAWHLVGASSINQQPSKGYVELPYTLAQDSTLFLVLGQTGPDLWAQKLRWVAKHGGMAMIGIHPDYMLFGNGRANSLTYPEKRYKDFLLWLRKEYDGSYWNATPREVAEYFIQMFKEKAQRCVTKLTILGSMFTAMLGDLSDTIA
jgi:hypothetical protein